ncbi:MAG TPA: Gfo/Idh/MocA family oxidoreductase [Armatimonadota bacterium]|nr:Gfo/Idh/MocA family oxidoreductase [Armatimonadota bacterium]
MTHRLRAAIIGCGGIAERHARGFSRSGRCALVAGADPNPGNLQRCCDQNKIPGRYRDYHEMLLQEKPDIVAICTWTGSHPSILLDCAAAGVRGVLCEKPMAVSLSECDRMIEACAAAGTFLGIGHHLRFHPSMILAREWIQSDQIGTPLLMRSVTCDGLANNASHRIDLARFFLGDPAAAWAIGQVERTTDRYERGVMIEDRAIGEVEMFGSHRLLIESDLTRGPHRLLVVGDRGMLRVVDSSVHVQNPHGDWVELRQTPDQPDSWLAESLAAMIPRVDFSDQHESFLNWIEGGTQYSSHAGNGRAAIECMAGLYESARQRRRVSFPVSSLEYPLPDMVESGQLPVEQPGAYDIRGGGPRWRSEKA